MPFIFLLVFALICLQTRWPAPPSWLTPEGCGVLVGTMVVASWLLAELIARSISWQMQRHPEFRSLSMSRYTRWKRNHFIGVLLIYLLTLYFLGWGHVLQQTWTDSLRDWLGFENPSILPGFQIGLMIPLFAGVFLSWERFYGVEKTAYEMAYYPHTFISRWSYLLTQIQLQMLLVLAPVIFLLVQQLFAFVPDWEEESYLAAWIAVAMMAASFVTMPLFLRAFLGLKPLAPGPLRTRLEELARRLRFRYSDILVWNTRNLAANALVTGFVPWFRYIVLTDRLTHELTPDETEAVFGHEIGHIKHHHLTFYLVFFLTSFVLLGFFYELMKESVRPFVSDEVKETLKMLSSFGKLALLSGYTWLVFGFVSRLCERQADLFGSHSVSTDAFISALEKVALINGIPRERKRNWLRVSWQHPTIAQRVEFLERMRDNPTLIRRFQFNIRIMQVVCLFVLASLLWCFQLARVLRYLGEF